MKTTANYGLKKPEGTDVVNIDDFNENADIIDTQIKSLNDKKIDYGTASGTNTYTVTIPGATLTEGRSYKIKFTNANTGASTLNINGLGAKEIRKSNGNPLSSGNIKAGQICHLVYTGSVFQLLGEGGEYGTATPDKVLTGYTIGTENGIVSGTMPNNGAKIITPSTTNQAIPVGYHNGSGYVKGDANLKAENIKNGVSIFGVTGTLEPRPSSVHTGTVNTTHSSSLGVQNLKQTFISAPNANYILFISDLDNDNIPYSYVANSNGGAPQASIGFYDGTKYFDFVDEIFDFADLYSSMNTRIGAFSVYIDKANNKAYTLLIYSQYMSNYEDSNLHAYSVKRRILDITGLNHNSLSIVSRLGSNGDYDSSSSAKLDGTFYYFS